MSLRESHLVSFELYDQNGDGFICPRDVFSVFERQLDPLIEEDVIMIAHFTQLNAERE
jgi:Ca2+-binding EF-hand superfamily protein